MDNQRIDVTSEGNEHFHKVLSLLPHKNVVGYRQEKGRLIFYWSDWREPKATKFLYPYTIKQAGDFALGWLEHVDYGPEPDHDGSNGKGWRIYNEDWGHVDHDQYAFVAIEPAWAMYGK